MQHSKQDLIRPRQDIPTDTKISFVWPTVKPETPSIPFGPATVNLGGTQKQSSDVSSRCKLTSFTAYRNLRIAHYGLININKNSYIYLSALSPFHEFRKNRDTVFSSSNSPRTDRQLVK